MTDLQKFMAAGAKIMHADRPDLWKTEEDALTVLAKWFSDLSGDRLRVEGKPVASIGTGGFELVRWFAPGDEWDEGDYYQYQLTRQLIDFTVEANQEDTGVFDWTTHGQVFNVGELGID